MQTYRPLLVAAVALALSAAPTIARADCGMPLSYVLQVQANTVTVCSTATGLAGVPLLDGGAFHPSCPTPGGVVRVDTATGVATRIPDVCGQGASEGCYVDECVPAGNYQYGYGDPYPCANACNTAYFATAAVAQSGTCASDAGQGTPTTAPWDGGVPQVNGYGIEPTCPYEASDAGSPVGAPDAAAEDSGAQVPLPDGGGSSLLDAGGDSAAPSGASSGSGAGGGGCSVTTPSTVEHTVLAVHGLALGLGLTFLLRRRTKK